MLTTMLVIELILTIYYIYLEVKDNDKFRK